MNVTNLSDNELVSWLNNAVFEGEISGLCKHMMKNHWATAKFQLASAHAMRLYQDVKVTFSDKIATFGGILSDLHDSNNAVRITLGGTMGLFTGMSLLSMLEVVFWLWKLLFSLFKPT